MDFSHGSRDGGAMLSHNITLNERTRLNTSCGNVQWHQNMDFRLLRAYII